MVGQQSGRCLDINNSTTANDTQVQLWDRNGGSNQRWTYTGGELVVYGPANGTKVQLWSCTGGANQHWCLVN
ncbi:RICIN domain-containing protein [Streptomyces sp. 2MCAF27]